MANGNEINHHKEVSKLGDNNAPQGESLFNASYDQQRGGAFENLAANFSGNDFNIVKSALTNIANGNLDLSDEYKAVKAALVGRVMESKQSV